MDLFRTVCFVMGQRVIVRFRRNWSRSPQTAVSSISRILLRNTTAVSNISSSFSSPSSSSFSSDGGSITIVTSGHLASSENNFYCYWLWSSDHRPQTHFSFAEQLLASESCQLSVAARPSVPHVAIFYRICSTAPTAKQLVYISNTPNRNGQTMSTYREVVSNQFSFYKSLILSGSWWFCPLFIPSNCFLDVDVKCRCSIQVSDHCQLEVLLNGENSQELKRSQDIINGSAETESVTFKVLDLPYNTVSNDLTR